MRRIDQVKNKKMKNVKHIEVLSKKRIKIVFNNNDEIVVASLFEDYDEVALFIEKDNIK